METSFQDFFFLDVSDSICLFFQYISLQENRVSNVNFDSGCGCIGSLFLLFFSRVCFKEIILEGFYFSSSREISI